MQVAVGFIKVANETMCCPIRAPRVLNAGRNGFHQSGEPDHVLPQQSSNPNPNS